MLDLQGPKCASVVTLQSSFMVFIHGANCVLNPFLANIPILYSLKTLEDLCFFRQKQPSRGVFKKVVQEPVTLFASISELSTRQEVRDLSKL